MNEITPRQKAFCDEYLKNFNTEDAAMYGHYNIVFARRLLHKKPIREYIKSQMDAENITSDFVLQGLKENALRSMEQTQYKEYNEELGEWIPSQSKEAKEFKYDPKSANTSLELLGKYLKLFTTVNENTNNNNNTEFIKYIKEAEDDNEW